MLHITLIFAALFAALGTAVGSNYYGWFPAFSQRGMTSGEIFTVIAVCAVVLAWIVWQVWLKPLPSYGGQKQKSISWIKDVVSFIHRMHRMVKEVTIL